MALVASVVALQPEPAAAEGHRCGVASGYHYAGQLTALDNTYTQCGTTNEYQGWNGIDGQLLVPATLASLGNYQQDHTLGLFSAQIRNDNYWLQPGWYTGCLAGVGSCTGTCQLPGCTWRGYADNYGWYVENVSPQGYWVWDFGDATFGSGRTVYMIYNSNDGCWEVQFSYGGSISRADCWEGIYHSGAMWAASEMDSNSGVVAGLPASYFGYSNPNTNEALRLHGGAGWVPWTSSLSSY